MSTSEPFSPTKAAHVVERTVYAELKKFGFRKHGRTLHRFVDGDISQVINFGLNKGMPEVGIRWTIGVNLGIRVPESDEQTFWIAEPQKAYYSDANCNIRCSLDETLDGGVSHYFLDEDLEEIGKDIFRRLFITVLPIFDTLNNREAIIEKRRDYPNFDYLHGRSYKIQNAMIYGRRGDMENATRLYNEHYNEMLKNYLHTKEHGTQRYMKKGEKIGSLNRRTGVFEWVTADKDGYYTFYDANRGHIDSLEKTAEKLGIVLTVDEEKE